MALLIRQFCSLVTLLFFLGTVALPVHADDNLQLAEQEIKAGLLYNFLKYTEWPTSIMEHASKIEVCILGDDPFGEYLQPMAGRTVNQREITLRNLRDIASAGSCQLLFINAAEKANWPALRKFISGKNILTVSDYNGFANAGGMIEFDRQDNHIHAELNMGAVTAAGLHVHERLLKLVTVMHGSQEGAQ